MAIPVIATLATTQKDSLGAPFEVAATTPSETAEDDLLVAWIVTDGGTSGTTITAPAGWNAITATLNRSDLVFCRGFWRKAVASEPSTHTFTVSQDERMVAGILRITGADVTTPIDIESNQTGKSDTPTCPTVTPTTDDVLVLAFCGVDDGDAGNDAGFPGGAWTNQWVKTNGTANECTNGCVSQGIASQTASGTAVYTGHTNEDWVGETIGIAQAVSGTLFFQSVAGAMPNATGDVATATTFAQALDGDMPSPTGELAKKTSITLTGAIPNATGDLFKATMVTLTGSMPNSVGALLKKTFKQMAGLLPASTGDVASTVLFPKALNGEMPNPTGGITKKTGKNVGGPMPPPSGTLVRKIGLNLDGTVPASTGDITKKAIVKPLAGNMPASAGAVAAIAVTTQALAGDMPSPTGGITKKIGKSFTGNMPASTGAVTKKTGKVLSGNAPNPTGNLAPSLLFLQANSGIMGAITGIVTTFKTVGVPVRKVIKIIGASFRKFLQ